MQEIQTKGKIKPGAWVLLGVVALVGLYFGSSYLGLGNVGSWLRGADKATVSPTENRQVINVDPSTIPASQVKAPERIMDDPPVTIGVWTWQAGSGLTDAVGGAGLSGSHPDSCLAQAGIKNTQLVVENDTSAQIKAIASGAMQIGTTTGDQSAVDLAGLNTVLGRNGARAWLSGGFSSGEDTFIAPESIKTNPQKARGIVVVTAVPYCDWNVTVDWAWDNKIPVNPDEATYDPDAVNFVNAVDHLEAAQKYVQNASVSLRNKKTGNTESHQIDAVATWTPGDVAAVEGRPSVTYKGVNEKVTRIISTQQYNYMMPNILFTTDTFLNQHRQYLETVAKCVVRSNDKIKQDPNYFDNRVAVLNSVLYNVPGRQASFWATYFKGSNTNGVQLGGSRVNSLSEMRHLFGMDQGVSLDKSVFGITYSDHANRVKQLMPERLPTILAPSQVVDLSILQAITLGGEKTTSQTYTSQFESSNSGNVFINSSYQIIFDSGSSKVNLTPQNVSALEEILSILTRADNTKVTLEGHTDNVGNDTGNLTLSKARATAVWEALRQMDKNGVIRQVRLKGIEGYGSYRPIADNNSEQGKAQNRRVTVVLN